MAYLFVYGSLLSLASASRTLLRPIAYSDLVLARAQGYRRTWTAAMEVIVAGGKSGGSYNALFLDLSPDVNQFCNGALLNIFDEEWERLDQREKSYDRITVQTQAGSAALSAFTYSVPAERKASKGIVLAGYVETIQQALKIFPETFSREFWQSTEAIKGSIVPGNYTFSDHRQNEAAGRR
jgi:hypothetical protein